MSTLYIDCRTGVSGVKLFGAFLDILEKPEAFICKFNGLGFRNMSIDRQAEAELGVTGSRLLFKRENDNPDYNEYGSEMIWKRKKHHTVSRGRTLDEVIDIISDLAVSETVYSRAVSIYENIAVATAKIKQRDADTVRMRRAGSRDTIASVVGVCMIAEELKCEKIIASTVAVGTGYANTSRGMLPVPVPLVQLFLDGVPYVAGTEETEMCTVEGIAILRELADEFSEMPEMNIIRSGVGFGGESYKNGVNCLKIHEGDCIKRAESSVELKAVISGGRNEIPAIRERLEKYNVTEFYAYSAEACDGTDKYLFVCICPNDTADRAANEILQNSSAESVQKCAISIYR